MQATSVINRLIWLTYLNSISCIVALHEDCFKHFEGFSLTKDYNRNIPPGNNTVIRIFHILNEIVGVCKKLSFFNNYTSLKCLCDNFILLIFLLILG